MKFQPEQKGLFTFYREQHLFQQEILAKRTHLQASAREPIKEKRKKKEAPDQPSQQPEKVISQPTPIQEDLSETKRPDNFLRYGEAVAIFKRKTAEQINPLLSPKNKQQSLPKEELGTYLQNKNMSFERPEKKEGAQVLQAPPRKKGHSKRMEKMRSSYSKPIIQGRSSTKLPSLVKVDQEDTASPPQYRSKVSGSILKANGGELLRHIRSRAVIEESEQEDQRSVSYFEFNRDVRRESGSKRGDLSMEQRKLLQILGRYRRYDH